MRSSCDFWLDRDDPISCRSGGACGPAPHHPVITLGAIRVYAGVSQLAALRDALDRWLCGEAGDEEYPDEDIFERMALDQECREEG